MNPVLTTCPFCACGCALYLHVSDGKPAGVIPSEAHPASRGRLCARGWAGHEAPAWGDRLTEPMVRHDGKLRPVAWETALEAAADGMVTAWRSGRTIGVLGSARATNEENYLAVRLARGALQTPHLDTCLAATYQPLLDGVHDITGRRGGTGSLADLERCEVVILLEGDVASSHPQVAGAIVRARKAGCRLVTIGALPTRMTALSALPIASVPGAERAVTHALVAAVLAAGRLDTAAVVAAGESFGGLVSSLSGATASEDVARAASWYARASRAAIVVAPLVAEAVELRRLAGDLATLAAVTGHLDRQASPLLILPARGNLRGACEAGVSPRHLPGYGRLLDETATAALRDVWGVRPLCEAGLEAPQLLAEARGVVVVAEDPVSVMPVAGSAREALQRMDCVVVLDAFATPTLEHATVVLPIASFAENDGTVTSLDGRLQRVRAAVEPPGRARPGWAVLAALLRRLGSGAEYRGADEVRQELARVLPAEIAARWRQVDDGGSDASGERGDGRRLRLAPLAPNESSAPAATVAVCDAVFDWGSDPLVRYSPTLCRDAVAQRKLFPRGFVELAKEAMDRLGVRPGWPVRLRSASGEAVAPALLRAGLAAGVVVVPFALREALAPVLGGHGVASVTVERA